MARNKYPEVTRARIVDTATELFLAKGYEHMTIQDIIDALGDLSKGAIYYHFKSKEDIVEAVLDNLDTHVDGYYEEIRSSVALSGIEKINRLFHFSIENTSQTIIIEAMPNMMKNPKFLAKQLDSTMNKMAPELIKPILLEGIADGSIQTEYPAELAEVLSLLANIWLNPMIFNVSQEQVRRRCAFFRQIMQAMNLNILDDELVDKIVHLGDNINKE